MNTNRRNVNEDQRLEPLVLGGQETLGDVMSKPILTDDDGLVSFRIPATDAVACAICGKAVEPDGVLAAYVGEPVSGMVHLSSVCLRGAQERFGQALDALRGGYRHAPTRAAAVPDGNHGDPTSPADDLVEVSADTSKPPRLLAAGFVALVIPAVLVLGWAIIRAVTS